MIDCRTGSELYGTWMKVCVMRTDVAGVIFWTLGLDKRAPYRMLLFTVIKIKLLTLN